MTTKRILFAVLCVLLVLVIIMTGIVIHKVSGLFEGGSISTNSTENSSTPSTAGNSESTEDTGSESQPSESTEATEPPHEHAYTTLVKKVSASCNTLGYTEYACSCGSVTFLDFVDALGHYYGAGQVIAPTCTEAGYTKFECSRCGDIDKRSETAALGHEFDEGTEIAATCTEDAFTQYKCVHDGCEEVKKENIQEGTATGHSFGQWAETETGEYQRVCTACGETETSAEPVVEPTEPLKILSAQFTDVTEETASYRLYLITVGTDENSGTYTYTISDYLNNGTLEYEYDSVQGLVITYEDGGDTNFVYLAPQQDGQCTIKIAPESTDPTDPTDSTNPTDPTDSTETSEPTDQTE